MQERPLVSVLMTAFNRELYIAEAVKSVLESTYTNFELIILDDESKDNTVAIAKSFQQKDSRIKVFVNDKNLGDYPNRNKAASYANGKYIMYLDSDDVLFKEGIENCVKSILKYPDINFAMYDTLGVKEVCRFDSREALRIHLLQKPFLRVGPGGTIISKEYFNTLNGYPDKYGPANDQYFNLKACCNSDIVMMPFDFVFYRRHEGQQINNQFSYLYNNYCYLRDALNELNLPISKTEMRWIKKKNNRRFVVNVAKYLLQKWDFRKAKEAINKAQFTLNDALSGIFH